ncbi:MAG: hypothetical protein C1941_04035 [Prosthecochloris sp.]|nr:hypothetical protein [Prosthecochloris sp.]
MLSDFITRREFLSRVCRYSSLSMMALFFGCDIARLGEGQKKKTALIYATRYGATKETATWIQEGMQGPVDLLDIETISFSDVTARYDHFIIGSGVWIGGVHKKIIEFLESRKKELSGRVLATFVVCGTDGSTESGRKRIDGYFTPLYACLDKKPLLSRYFGGRVIVENLTDEDRQALTVFYKTYLRAELRSWDRTDPEKAALFGGEVKRRLGEKMSVSESTNTLVSRV